MDEKSHANILINNISYKTLIDSKPLRIRFDEIDGFIKIYDRTRYLTLLGSKMYDTISNRVRYFISLKSCTTYGFSHYFGKIKVDSFDYLPKKRRLTLHNVTILTV